MSVRWSLDLPSDDLPASYEVALASYRLELLAGVADRIGLAVLRRDKARLPELIFAALAKDQRRGRIINSLNQSARLAVKVASFMPPFGLSPLVLRLLLKAIGCSRPDGALRALIYHGLLAIGYPESVYRVAPKLDLLFHNWGLYPSVLFAHPSLRAQVIPAVRLKGERAFLISDNYLVTAEGAVRLSPKDWTYMRIEV